MNEKDGQSTLTKSFGQAKKEDVVRIIEDAKKSGIAEAAKSAVRRAALYGAVDPNNNQRPLRELEIKDEPLWNRVNAPLKIIDAQGVLRNKVSAEKSRGRLQRLSQIKDTIASKLSGERLEKRKELGLVDKPSSLSGRVSDEQNQPFIVAGNQVGIRDRSTGEIFTLSSGETFTLQNGRIVVEVTEPFAKRLPVELWKMKKKEQTLAEKQKLPEEQAATAFKQESSDFTDFLKKIGVYKTPPVTLNKE